MINVNKACSNWVDDSPIQLLFFEKLIKNT